MRIFIATIFLSFCSLVHAQEFMPQQVYSTPVVQSPVIYQVSPVQQPVVVYQWVPYTAQQTVVVDHYCLFRKTQTVVTKPVTQWIYQPVLIYR